MPKSPREFSLTHKITALAPGEFMILPDPSQTLDRQLITLRSRSKILKGIPFEARRVKYIEGDRILPGLRIERTDNAQT